MSPVEEALAPYDASPEQEPAETVETPAAAVVPENNWPNEPAEHGKIYSFIDPVWKGQMVGMTMDTFLSIRKDVNDVKAALTKAQYENVQLFQELQRRPPPQDSGDKGPRIITPATGMLPRRN
jgi:hypothetical protein